MMVTVTVPMVADSVKSGQEMTVHLVAPTKQEKAAWITDISQVIAGARQEVVRCSVQCMDNVHFDNLYNNTSNSSSATVVPQFVKSDPSLFKDDVDIRSDKINYNYLSKLSTKVPP